MMLRYVKEDCVCLVYPLPVILPVLPIDRLTRYIKRGGGSPINNPYPFMTSLLRNCDHAQYGGSIWRAVSACRSAQGAEDGARYNYVNSQWSQSPAAAPAPVS